MILDVESICDKVSTCKRCWSDADGGLWCWGDCNKNNNTLEGNEELIKEITKQEALELLTSGQNVWVYNKEQNSITSLLDAINGTLIADIIRDDEQCEEVPKELEKPKKQGGPKKEVPTDVGKIGALYKAGWSMAKIADEMNLTDASVLYHLRKMGLKEDKK